MDVHFMFLLVNFENSLVKTVFASYCLKLSLHMFLNCFFSFA